MSTGKIPRWRCTGDADVRIHKHAEKTVDVICGCVKAVHKAWAYQVQLPVRNVELFFFRSINFILLSLRLFETYWKTVDCFFWTTDVVVYRQLLSCSLHMFVTLEKWDLAFIFSFLPSVFWLYWCHLIKTVVKFSDTAIIASWCILTFFRRVQWIMPFKCAKLRWFKIMLMAWWKEPGS